MRLALVMTAAAAVAVAAVACEKKGAKCAIVPTEPLSVCALTGGPFSADVTNPFFPLRVGSALVLEGIDEGELIHLEIRTLDSTEVVGGVTTRVVEERETIDGTLYEVSRNFFAQAPDGTVCYFGEDVDFYENGVVVGHAGAWRAGNGNEPGIQMPGAPAPGMAYSQEVAPGIAEDRAEIVTSGGSITVPAGTFTNVLHVHECNPLERDSDEFKDYAYGVGLVNDAGVELVP